MTAKEIIIRLVDEGKISGEEAFILIDAIKPSIVYQPYEIKPYNPWWKDTWYKTEPYTITCTNNSTDKSNL